MIPKDDDDSPYLPPRSASAAILDELSNLRDEVRGVRDAVQGISVGGFLTLILIVLAVQAFCLFVLAYDIHHTLNPSS